MTFTTVSTATVSGLVRNADTSGSDQEHAVGAIVEFVPDVLWAQSIQDTFETEHNADGIHGTITTDTISEQTATNGVAIDGLTIKDAGFELTSDADGDVYYRNSGALVRLAKGSDDEVLTLASGVPSWAAGAGGDSITLTPAPDDHNSTGIKVTLTANEDQAFGDVGYINSDGEVQLGDADAIATSSVVAMCAAATISADAAGVYLLQGIARDDTWDWTVGGLIYLTVTGTTANTLSQTAPSATDDVVQILGVATHADRMYFNPQLSQVEVA